MNPKAERIDWRVVFDPKSLILIIVGVFFAAVALEAFMLPNRFLDGGVTGIAIIVGAASLLVVAIYCFSENLIGNYTAMAIFFFSAGATMARKASSQVPG